MKITKRQLKTTMALLKPMEEKNQSISMQVVDGTVEILAKREGAFLKLKMIKTEDEETEKISIKKDFLQKLEKQGTEEVVLKINKKTLSSKVNGMSFTTSILVEELAIDFPEDEGKGTKIAVTTEIMKSINTALSYTAKDSKRPQLLGVNLALKDKVLSINASDTFKLYTSGIKVDT